MPYFITVSNIQSKEVARVSAGNERVIRPRLSDAEFFWKRDCEVSLMKRVSELSHVVFQKKLGSVSEKVDRVTQLASHIARQLNESVELVERAAQLAKADLMTEMVGEFPELQGVMGHYYAQVAGENPAVIHAMDNHYRPRFGGDAVASDAIAYIVAIADKLDTIVGIFGVGQIPTGEKDPFALRRAALGVQRTLIENRLPLDLAKLIEHSIKTFKTGLLSKDTPLHVFDYMMERLRSYYSDQGIRPDEFESVREIRSTVPFDFHRRINAVHEFRKLPQAESLAAANKRCRNILRKSEDQVSDVVDISLFEYDEEKALYQALEKITEEADEKLDNGDYEAALEAMAQLKDSVDAFFDTVLVMAEDERIRKNRLGLLSKLGLLFLKVADISHLQS